MAKTSQKARHLLLNEADLLMHKKVDNLTQIKASDFDALLAQLKAKP